jgi:hypothetical protein
MLIWKKAKSGNIPADAVPCGFSKIENETLYVARASYEGGTHIGKVGKGKLNQAHIPYGGKEIRVDDFEVLCVDGANIHIK